METLQPARMGGARENGAQQPARMGGARGREGGGGGAQQIKIKKETTPMGQSHSVEKLYNKRNTKGALLDSFTVEAVTIHHLNPRLGEVANELLEVVVLGIELAVRAEDRVRTEDEVDACRAPALLA